jgi:hypothetical protein
MNGNRNHKLLAGTAGVTLMLALAVSAGAVPRPGDNGEVHTASVAAVQEIAAAPARQPGDSAAPPVVAAPATPAAPAGEAAPAQPATTVAKPRTTTPPTTKAPRSTPATAPATPAATAPAPTVPVTVAKVARRTPSAAEVQTVITELKRQVGGLLLLLSPTPAQIAQAGDQVCTAFDGGQTFAQVKATGLSMIPASVTVTPATADWAVRQAVTLYCPGHASKLT